MDEHTHHRMIDRLLDTMFIIWYFSTGEPLLNKNFPALVESTRGKEIFSIVSTNLSLALRDDDIERLLQCGIGLISVGLDGTSSDSYSRYRVKGDYDLVVGNVRRLIKRKRELGLAYPLIEWRFLVFRHNQYEMRKARRLAERYGVDLLEFSRGAAPPTARRSEVRLTRRRIPDPSSFGPALQKAKSDRETAVKEAVFGQPCYEARHHPPRHMLSQKCDFLYFGTTLFPNGSVSPCCVSNQEPDDYGHISDKEDFCSIWNNDRYQRARGLFKGGEAGNLVCSRCPLVEARDYQFRFTLRALVRNAPDWCLKILSRDSSRFFLDADIIFSPVELGVLQEGKLERKQIPSEVEAWLDKEQTESPWLNEQIQWMRAVLKEQY